MKLASLQIPDDPADWPDWLEEHLVGLRLGELAAELQLLVGQDEAEPALDDVLGDQASAVLEAGLGVLQEGQIRQLMKHPRLLLELQERVLIDGSDYWQGVPLSDEHRRTLQDHWAKLDAQISQETAEAVHINERTATKQQWRRKTLTIISIAATLLIVALGIWAVRPSGPTWGFDQSGLLTANIPAGEYLKSLANAADDWFNKRPQSKRALAQRLRDFRHGCDTLIAAPHPQLSPEDRDWLIERCRAWRDKIDGHLAALQNEQTTFQESLRNADETINKLKDALRRRAERIS